MPRSVLAQPWSSGRHFSPVDSNAERDLMQLLMKLQWDLDAEGISTRIKKPVFDRAETDLDPAGPTS